MKTKVYMERELMGDVVRQDSKTGMFSANDMNLIGNAYRSAERLPAKLMSHYFNQEATGELINAICIEENLKEADIKKSTKGRNGGTWVHPIIFVDMAMWYSPKLKVKIINWVLDGLLFSRNESGISFREMNSELVKYHAKEFDNSITYSMIANQISRACGVSTCGDKWQKASESQLKLRDRIHENICLLADVSPNVGTCINKSIEKAIDKERKRAS